MIKEKYESSTRYILKNLLETNSHKNISPIVGEGYYCDSCGYYFWYNLKLKKIKYTNINKAREYIDGKWFIEIPKCIDLIIKSII